MNAADEEDRMAKAAWYVGKIIEPLPTDLAIGALMAVVADLVRNSSDPAALWAALAYGIEVHGKLQHRILSDPPERPQ